MKIAAIVVSRKGSKRIFNKSKQKINNENLIERKLKQLSKVKLINKIYLGTNDVSLEKFTKKKIKFIKREDKFCDENKTNAIEMVKNMLSFVEEEIILWAHATNPFIDHNLYKKAINIFLKSKKKNDSLFSTSILKNHFWDQHKKPLNHNPKAKKHVVAKKLKAIYSQNGGILIRLKKDMIKDGKFVGKKPIMFTMNEIQGWDLDYPWQLELARTLVKFRYAK